MATQQRVFISYRRKEPVAAGFVYRFAERLESHFGKGHVFLDANALPYGRDFRDALLEELDRADILFVIIGPGWVERLHELIDEPKDYVRIEVEHALTSKRAPRVIPILVGGVSMPRSSELPEQVKNLANMQGTSIDTQRLFHETCERLIQDLSKSSKPKQRKSRFALVAVAVAAILAAGWGYVQFSKTPPVVETPPVKIDKPADPPLVTAPPEPVVIVPPTTRSVPLSDNLSIELVRVEPGRFLMGNPAHTDAASDYKAREVELKSEFWISKSEISRAQWAVVMAGATPSAAEAQDPKTGVSYSEIVGPGGFLERLNELPGDAAWEADLPTEAEWQHAAILSAESKLQPPLVGMTGAAAEWCRDWHQVSSIGMTAVDPTGPSSGKLRVVRGSPDSLSALHDRAGLAPSTKNPQTGFRIILRSAGK